MQDIKKIVFIIQKTWRSVVTYFFLFVPTTKPYLEHTHTHLYYHPFPRTILLQNRSLGWNWH